MQTKIIWRRTAVLALATATLLSLTACAAGAPSSSAGTTAASVSPTKEAGIFTKDLRACFDNASSQAVTIEWISGISSNSGAGTLATGQSLCGEGVQPTVGVTFADSFATHIFAYNPAIGQPGVAFNSVAQHKIQTCTGDSCSEIMQSDTYADAVYAEGETVGSDVEGHHFSVTRTADDDWINFTVTIID